MFLLLIDLTRTHFGCETKVIDKLRFMRYFIRFITKNIFFLFNYQIIKSIKKITERLVEIIINQQIKLNQLKETQNKFFNHFLFAVYVIQN